MMNEISRAPASDGVEGLLNEPGRAVGRLGLPGEWDPVLRHAVRFMLDAATPMFIGWGPQLCQLYNDATLALVGRRHPGILGQPMREAWPQAWTVLEEPIRRALAGESFHVEQPALELPRAADAHASAWLDLAFAPLRGLDGAIHGFSCTISDITPLRESEAKFRVITDAMPQMVWSTLPDGYHDYYNQRWYDFTGMREGDTDGERWATMFHPDDRERAWALWRHALETGAQYEVEYRLRHHSGEYRWVLGRALPVRDEGGRIVRWMGTCTDIDQHKRNEEILLDARLRQEAALVAADIGTWTYDLQQDRVFADRNLARLFGVDPGEAAGGRLGAYLAAIHPDDVAQTRAAIELAVESGAGYECNYRVRAGAGWRHLLARGKVARDATGRAAWLPGIVLDVSRQKEAEEALRESEARFRRLAESNVIGIIRYRLDGTITDANQAFLDMLGYTREEMERGEMTSQRLTPAEWRASNDEVIERLRTVGRMENYVKEYYRKDGSRASVQIGAATAGGGEGIAYVVDISAIRDAQHALREADRRKDEFLAMLAHELRNPLAPIAAAADFLKIGKADEARIRQVTAIIARQASHMTGLIDDLLDVSRVTRGLITLESGPVQLAAVVGEAVEQVRPLVKAKDHDLELHMPPDDALIHGDRKRLVQIFANLLGNAAKYTPDGGRIDVRIRVAEDEVEVDVSDDGIGMSAELAGRAFELFSQGERSADRSQGGLGIGLALVKSLVELHGGSVDADSAGPGKGSRFTVVLPRYHQEHEGGFDAAASAGAVAPADALDVLIVDDNVDAAEILAMYIEAVGHRCTVCHSPGRALEHAARHRPDLCVLDIGLPEFDGYELARRLRAQPGMQHLPLVAVSGYGQAQDREKALAAGFDSHFVKPVKAADILAVMDNVAKAKRIG
ncbi:PAS domain S-box protein [Massilia sp. YIM B02763]|uniref:hybrid sensor histidine kinase/response regulator n=1 Tax=Massilia sp. YIM B02763 TaxID=3050130 RepID=UPI0025B6E780|nr:PAS domain S-box protein [Massilia sp. YIM B02763]MDN4051576.1 PAS domain S-box protein [Massilia sp. YIM B02763]